LKVIASELGFNHYEAILLKQTEISILTDKIERWEELKKVTRRKKISGSL
jgi:hypothetical protein